MTLPVGWVSIKLNQICEIIAGQSPPSSAINLIAKGLPFFQGKAEFGHIYPAILRYCEFPSKTARKGDILISVRAPVGPTNLAPSNCGIGRGLCAVRPETGINQLFILYQLRLLERNIAALGSGSTFAAITKSDVANIQLWLAPSREQDRIIEKLEELFSELDVGVAELQAAKTKLSLYRKALLKSAIEGKFTQAWREKRIAENTPLETGEQLLQRILKERRQRWEEKQLAKFKEQDKTPPKDWREKYPEPIKPNTADLPKLPEGWAWATVDQCSSFETSSITDGPFGSNLKSIHYRESGPRVIRLQNIGDGEFIDAKAHIAKDHYERLIKHSVEEGDVVVAMLGETLPKACVIPSGISPAIVKADCAKIRVNKNLILPYYLSFCLNSKIIQKQVAGQIKGVGRPRVNILTIRQIIIPLPSLAEQAELEGLIIRTLDNINEQQGIIDNVIQDIVLQRKSILVKAFSGKLVSQNPEDEPATSLLERIRQTREELKAQPKPERIPRAKREEIKSVKPILEVLPDSGQMSVAELLGNCGLSGANSTAEIEMFYISLRDLLKQEKIQVVRESTGDYVSRLCES